MFRPFTLTLAVATAIGLSLACADSAEARHRRCGSDGGSGSYGGHGSFGGGGSFGGMFSRRGNDCHEEGYGSAGGHGSCGSHGGAYYHDEDGDQEYGASRDFDPGEAPPAPPSNFEYSDEGDRARDNSGPADAAESRDKVDAAVGNDQDNI